MGLFGRKSPKVQIHEWRIIGDEGAWNYDIVGESKYQPALQRAVAKYAGRDERESGRLVLDLMQAAVEPEPSNAFDPMALRVAIDGRTVGYVPAADAPRFAEICRYMVGYVLGRELANAFAWRAPVDARIGWLPGAPDLVYGVKLALPSDFWTRDE